MKVLELLEALAKVPLDAEVVFAYSEAGAYENYEAMKCELSVCYKMKQNDDYLYNLDILDDQTREMIDMSHPIPVFRIITK